MAVFTTLTKSWGRNTIEVQLILLVCYLVHTSMIIVLDALLKETSVRDMVSLIVKSVLVLGLRDPGFNTWLGHWHIVQGGESHTLSHFMLYENGDKPWTGGPLGSSTDSSLFFPGNIYAHPYSNYLLQAWPKANNPFPLMYSVWVIFSYCLRSNYLQISYISLTRYIENKFDCQYIWLEKNYTTQEGRWLWKGQWLNPTMPVVVREGERRQRNLFRVRERGDLLNQNLIHVNAWIFPGTTYKITQINQMSLLNSFLLYSSESAPCQAIAEDHADEFQSSTVYL